MDGIISSPSHIKETATSNAGVINDILLQVEDFIMLHNDSSSSSFSPIPTSCQAIRNKQPTVLPVYIYLQLHVMKELNMITVIWRSCVVQEDGQD